MKLRRLMIPLCVAIAAFMVAVFTVSSHPALAAAPKNCTDPVNKWYECYQKLSDVDRYVNSWCSGAATASRVTCQVTLLGSLNYSPPDLRILNNDCKDPGKAAKIKNQCWVVIKSSSSWYKYLKRYGEECGGFVNTGRDCGDAIKNEFLETNKWIDPDASTGIDGNIDQSPVKSTPFIKRITAYLRWLIIGIGVLAVLSLVIAGIQYSAAQDNPQTIAAAKGRINNVVIGILIYFVMFAALQWLIPGGVF